ncbi:uncharacterized protein SOCE836_042670 [Sorangium cellulosum]|uniref:Uncharacterized protein n=1 Tax=Sorangium cellulosum TaxID=56 RepID=A0A4P2QQH8_SORCE|nr:uncharacterized protein SOCE836_042670 [Sorangium cellulosum]WCQ91501.1 hypothetical protein NQZ70_04223 [Sorangium sp. Soce836]
MARNLDTGHYVGAPTPGKFVTDPKVKLREARP